MSPYSSTSEPSHYRPSRSHALLPLLAILVGIIYTAAATPAAAQLSLASTIDLALRANPRILSAKDDIQKANAQLSQVYDAYVPTINVGGGIGQAYGYSPNPPTLATVSGGSLVYSASHWDLIHSAKEGVKAAQLALEDAHEAVAEDAALAFIALDHDQQRAQAIRQQSGYATSLVNIVQQRLDAGQDTQINLTEARLDAAQLRLSALKADDDVAYDREHLARIIDLPATSLVIDGRFPDNPIPLALPEGPYVNSGIAAAFASAHAQQEQAAGQARFRYWPEINLVAQYNRYATFTESFDQLKQVYKITENGVTQTLLTANEGAFGIQITLPILDRGRSAKAREAAAEAAKSYHDAQTAEYEALDGASRLRHSITELQAQSDVATLQQQLAQQQLEVVQTQLKNGNGTTFGQQMSPADEQKAHIAEREKYIAILDADFQLRQAEIQLLRQTGGLESWLKSSPTTPPASQP